MAPANISSLVERWRNIHIDVPSNKPPEPPPGLVGKVDRKHETLSPLSCMPPELDASSTIWFALLVADQVRYPHLFSLRQRTIMTQSMLMRLFTVISLMTPRAR